MIMQRDMQYFSLLELFEASFVFYGNDGEHDGGRDYIENIIRTYGVDEDVSLTVDLLLAGVPDDTVYSGLLNLEGYKIIDDSKLRCGVIRDDLWTRFVNREATPVDIQSTENLDGDTVSAPSEIRLAMSSQIIDRQTQYTGHSGDIDTIAECIVATTANISLSGLQTIDGVALIVGRRVLVKDQSSAVDNGVYIVSTGSWTRAADANTGDELAGGIVYIKQGTTNAGKTFKQTADPVTIGVTSLTFSQYNYVDDYLLFEYPDDGTVDVCSGLFNFYIPATVDPSIKEIEESYTPPVFAVENHSDLVNQIEIVEGFGVMTISGTISLSYNWDILHNNGGPLDSVTETFTWYYQINDDAPVEIIAVVDVDAAPFTHPKQVTLNGSSFPFVVNLGDRIKTFIRINIDPDWSECSGDYTSRTFYGGITTEEVTFDFKSEADETQAEGFLIHDLAGAILDRITTAGRFYSEYLGSGLTSYRQYANDGCAWNYGAFKGLHIRGYTLSEKKHFESFKGFWEGVNPVFNLGLGYEEINGVQCIRIENKSYFFDPEPVVTLSWVNNIEEDLDTDHVTKKITVGYNNWQAEEVRGIDDPQTKSIFATRFKNIGKEMTISSTWIGASLAIETTRRKTIERSKDYKFDNNTFLIALNPEPEGSPFIYSPELTENFDDVSNLSNAATRYNIFLTPIRNLHRWLIYFNGCLQDYLASAYKFVSGEGNYDLSTQYDCTDGLKANCEGTQCGTVSESQGPSVSPDYLFTPTMWTFEHPLIWEEYKAIRDNRRNAILVSGTDSNYSTCFIKRLEYDITKSKAKFVVWKK
jgi:hypothetical protein